VKKCRHRPSVVTLAEEDVIELRARTDTVVIPAQAGIHGNAATAGSGQARSAEIYVNVNLETCSSVDPGLRRDDVVSIFRSRA
jgi:hypothetical protein